MASGIDRLTPIPTTGIGLPDYSTQAPLGAVPNGNLYTNSDPGELAARLGVYNSVDRRGSVVVHDAFEDGLEAWDFALGAGAGALNDWSAESSRNGGFSLKLSGGLATTSTARRYWGVQNPNKAGMEFSFSVLNFNQLMAINYYSDNVNLYYPAWMIMGQVLYIWDMTAGFVPVISNIETYFNTRVYNTVKLVFDTQTGKYVRILMNQLEKNISNYAPPLLPVVIAGKYMAGEFQIASRAAANDTVYIDEFIATVNESDNT